MTKFTKIQGIVVHIASELCKVIFLSLDVTLHLDGYQKSMYSVKNNVQHRHAIFRINSFLCSVCSQELKNERNENIL